MAWLVIITANLFSIALTVLLYRRREFWPPTTLMRLSEQTTRTTFLTTLTRPPGTRTPFICAIVATALTVMFIALTIL